MNYFLDPNLIICTKLVSTCKRRNQQKNQLSQLNETLNDFVIVINTNVGVMENETVEPQTDGRYNNWKRIFDDEINSCQYQVIENSMDDKIKNALYKAVMAVENRMHDTISTAMDNVVIPRIEMALRSITGLSGHGPNSEIQNPDRRDFLGNAGTTSLMSASSRLDWNTNQDRNDETRYEENFEDGDFPALRPNFDRQTHTHHTNVKVFFKNWDCQVIKFKSVTFELEIIAFPCRYNGGKTLGNNFAARNLKRHCFLARGGSIWCAPSVLKLSNAVAGSQFATHVRPCSDWRSLSEAKPGETIHGNLKIASRCLTARCVSPLFGLFWFFSKSEHGGLDLPNAKFLAKVDKSGVFVTAVAYNWLASLLYGNGGF